MCLYSTLCVLSICMCILHIVFCTVCKYVLSICKLLLFFLHCLEHCRCSSAVFLHCLSICKLFVVFLHCLSICKLFVVFLHCLSICKLLLLFFCNRLEHCKCSSAVFCTVCPYVNCLLFFCTVWSMLIRISLTKAPR